MKNTFVALFVLIVLAVPAVSQAAVNRPGPYVSGFLGVSVPQDTTVTTIDYLGGTTFNDRVEFDPGVNIGAAGGYDFGVVRLEGELSYKHSEIKSITDQADGFRFGNPDGSLGAFAMMFNTFFDLDNNTPVTPYFGGGIGFASLHLSDTFGIETRNGPAHQVLLYPSDDATVFAYQAGAGLEIALNRRVSLDLGYRYFGTSKAKFDTSSFETTELKLETHTGTVGVRVKF